MAEASNVFAHAGPETKDPFVSEIFSVYPGIELCFYSSEAAGRVSVCPHLPLAAGRCAVRNHSESAMQIIYCRQGGITWQGKDGAGQLACGETALCPAAFGAGEELSFPSGVCEGISVFVDGEKFAQNLPDVLRDARVDIGALTEKFCGAGKRTVIEADGQIAHIFSELYDLSEKGCLPYLRLKVQELLLVLSVKEQSVFTGEACQNISGQAVIIKEIHDLLTQNPSRRFTIEELAKRYLINTSSLKAGFKKVYGRPVALYMKEYRMKQAAMLLRDSNDSIAEIAAAVGYRSQSKFTKAFQEVMQILPKKYRKQYR